MDVITEIQYAETVTARYPVLRERMAIATFFFDGDELETTKHFGFFCDEKLTGGLSVYQNKSLNFNAVNRFQCL